MTHATSLTCAPPLPSNAGGSDPPSGMRRRIAPTEAAPTNALPTEAAPGGSAPDLLCFIRHSAPPAKVIALRFGVSRAEAEEIRQDTFEAMLKVPAPIRSPLAWFWAAAELRKRRIVSWKQRARRHEPALQMLARQQQPPFPSPEEAVAHRERERAVEDFLAHVKPCRRRVAELRLSGLDDAQVAGELGRPIGTVQSRWSRAKKEAKTQWAVVMALAALCLWLLARLRLRTGSLAGGPGRRAGGLFACAALSLLVTAHTGKDPPPLDAPRIEETSVSTPQDRWLAFSPFLSTNAEREREAGSPRGRHDPALTTNEKSPPGVRSPPASTALRDPRVRRDGAAAPAPSPAARLESARAHLAAAHRALWVSRDRDGAREILELYELTFPEDPFPGKHGELAAALQAP